MQTGRTDSHSVVPLEAALPLVGPFTPMGADVEGGRREPSSVPCASAEGREEGLLFIERQRRPLHTASDVCHVHAQRPCSCSMLGYSHTLLLRCAADFSVKVTRQCTICRRGT